jgi:hypothetical protein
MDVLKHPASGGRYRFVDKPVETIGKIGCDNPSGGIPSEYFIFMKIYILPKKKSIGIRGIVYYPPLCNIG